MKILVTIFLISITITALLSAIFIPLYFPERMMRQFANTPSSLDDFSKAIHLQIDVQKAALDWLQVVFGAVTAAGLGGTLFYTARNYHVAAENLRVTEYSKVTEGFAKAIEMLGNDDVIVRVGAVYALGRMAFSSSADHWRIISMLCAHARNRSPYLRSSPDEAPSSVQIDDDVQAVMDVLRTRKYKHEVGGEDGINLSSTNLNGANLRGIYLHGARLQNSDLTGAQLSYADLRNTDFSGSILSYTNFESSDLRGAILKAVLLDGTRFIRAKVKGANLAGGKGNAFNTYTKLDKIHRQVSNIEWLR